MFGKIVKRLREKGALHLAVLSVEIASGVALVGVCFTDTTAGVAARNALRKCAATVTGGVYRPEPYPSEMLAADGLSRVAADGGGAASAAESARGRSADGDDVSRSEKLRQRRERLSAKRAAKLAEELKRAAAAAKTHAPAKGGGELASSLADERKISQSGHHHRVKTGKSRITMGANGLYHVDGVGGLDFGSENGLDRRLQPLMSVKETDAGTEFQNIVWRSNAELESPVYGFEKAWLNHTYDTKELSSVTFHKKFPMTEEGVRQAAEFYTQLEQQVRNDLGLELKDHDNTGKTTGANLFNFTGKGDGTTLSGNLSSWNQKEIHVTLNVSDKSMANSSREQGAAAYDRADEGLNTTRINVVNRNFTQSHERAVELLERVQK